MASTRASETSEQTLQRREQNIKYTWQACGPQKHMKNLTGRNKNRLHRASMRASETHEENLNKQEQNRIAKHGIRAIDEDNNNFKFQQRTNFQPLSMAATRPWHKLLGNF